MQDITKNLNSYLKSYVDALAWWAEKKEELTPMLEVFESAGCEIELTCSGFDIKATGDRAKLVSLMRLLYSYGYKSSSKPESGKNFYGAFYYLNGIHSDKSIWFSFSSTVCKRVQVGTELKEVPVYEMRCEGGDFGVTDEEVTA